METTISHKEADKVAVKLVKCSLGRLNCINTRVKEADRSVGSALTLEYARILFPLLLELCDSLF